jgi:hypothetical protein
MTAGVIGNGPCRRTGMRSTIIIIRKQRTKKRKRDDAKERKKCGVRSYLVDRRKDQSMLLRAPSIYPLADYSSIALPVLVSSSRPKKQLLGRQARTSWTLHHGRRAGPLLLTGVCPRRHAVLSGRIDSLAGSSKYERSERIHTLKEATREKGAADGLDERRPQAPMRWRPAFCCSCIDGGGSSVRFDCAGFLGGTGRPRLVIFFMGRWSAPLGCYLLFSK